MILSKLRAVAINPSFQRVLKFGKTAFSPKYLLFTNFVIGGSLSGFGDVIEQVYQHSQKVNTLKWEWDGGRTARMFASGVILTPFVHFWYLNLDRVFPGMAFRTVLIKMVPDLFLFSPAYILAFLAVTGILEGQSWKNFKREVVNKSSGLFQVEVFLWTPAQFINFAFVPTRFRVLYDSFICLVSDVLYSYFRFDYEVEDDDEYADNDDESKTHVDKKRMSKEILPQGLLAACENSQKV